MIRTMGQARANFAMTMMALQGCKSIIVKQTRKAPANEFEDTKPFFTISEEGGKTYACGFGGAGE